MLNRGRVPASFLLPMKNSILFDVQEYLENAYPSLTDDQIDLIASDVTRRWDYTWLIDNVDVKCRETANYANIPLRAPFSTEYRADISDNEPDEFQELEPFQPMEHTSEGC